MARLDLLTANDRPGAYPPSWYAATATPLAPFPALAGEVTADVCVVGGGYTGLSAALHLAEAGLDVVLVEAQRVGWGASGRNGGQVGSGQRRDQGWLEARLGAERARLLWDLAEEAKALVRGLVERHGIACDLKPGVIHAARRASEVPHYAEEAEKLARDYGYAAVEPLDRAGIAARVGSDAFHGGLLDRGAMHLHPLNYALGLARAATAAGVRVFEGSRVEAIEPEVRTAAGRVRARFTVLAGNGYLGGLVPEVAARVMPINNFIVATAPLGEEAAAAAAAVRRGGGGFALRRQLLPAVGGPPAAVRRRRELRLPLPARTSPRVVRPRMLAIFPGLAGTPIDYAWGGTLAITVNRLPAFQRLGPTVFSAAGYSGHGVALATLAGKLIAEAVQGTAGRFDVFARLPQPRFPGGGALRWPLLALAMSWHALRDRL